MNSQQKFLNDLYVVKNTHSESVNKLTVQVEINPGHALFKGHFPGNPILPGVVTIQILKELLSEHLGFNISLARAASIKYLSFVNPEKNSLIEFDMDLKDMENGNLNCISGIHYGNTVFCSFKGEFSKEEK